MHNSSAPDVRLRIVPLGNTLSLLLAISYLLCVGFGLLAPEQMRMYEAWAPLLPGFEWLTWTGFFIGLIGLPISSRQSCSSSETTGFAG